MIETDVAVIGAGPAGAATAEKLAESGHDVVMIEKDAFAGETNVCGGSMDAAFAADLGLPNEIVKRINRWIYYFPFKVQSVPMDNLSFARNKFDRYLADRAVRRGVRLFNYTAAVSVDRTYDEINVMTVNRNTKEKQTVRSKLVVFSDGPSTLGQKAFGIGFHGTPTNTALGAIYEFEHDGTGDSYDLFFDQKISPWGYGWVFPKWDHLNVGVGCLISKLNGHLKDYLDYFVFKHPIVAKKLEGKRKIRFAAATIPLVPAERISDTRALMVGDAAGMVDSIWGGGIGFALGAANLAARVASDAIAENRFDAGFMSQYDRLWRNTQDYKLLRKFKMMSDLALTLQPIYTNVYPRLVDFLIWYSEARNRIIKRREPFH